LRWQDRLRHLQQTQTPYRLTCLAPPDWNTARLIDELPDFLVLSEFEYGDAKRLRRPDYEQFMRTVEAHYNLVQTFINHPLPYRKSDMPPHDLLYIYPEVRVYQKR
jgi:hypothetical protein